MLGTDDTTTENAATSLLYAGEYYDSAIDQYYLRARCYNPWSGSFNRSDPFVGSPQDPQSLHKYLYCHNNPINAIDPSGLFSFIGTLKAISCISLMSGIIGGVMGGLGGGYRGYQEGGFWGMLAGFGRGAVSGFIKSFATTFGASRMLRNVNPDFPNRSV